MNLGLEYEDLPLARTGVLPNPDKGKTEKTKVRRVVLKTRAPSEGAGAGSSEASKEDYRKQVK
jgi:hypothetical protein